MEVRKPERSTDWSIFFLRAQNARIQKKLDNPCCFDRPAIFSQLILACKEKFLNIHFFLHAYFYLILACKK